MEKLQILHLLLYFHIFIWIITHQQTNKHNYNYTIIYTKLYIQNMSSLNAKPSAKSIDESEQNHDTQT